MTSEPNDPLSEDEQEFVADLRALKDEAWKVLHLQHGAWLRQVLRRRLPRKIQHLFDLDDVLQVTFIKACERMSEVEYRNARSFREFLRRIGASTLQDRVRHYNRRRRDIDSETHGIEAEKAPATRSCDRSPSSVFSRKESSEDLLAALAFLPKTDRDIVWRRAVEGMRWNQIAEASDCTTDAARRRFHRSVRVLADRVRKHA